MKPATMTVAVIGRGLMGSAAARHLAKAGLQVTVLGPPEPENKQNHSGVFGSHYDEGRITRKNALDPWWVNVSTAAIDRYADIEAESGIRFFAEVGAVMAGKPDWLARVDAGRLAHDVPCDVLDADALRARFPYFAFSPDIQGYHEPDRAGHISPRRLVAAQTEAARRAGARHLDCVVHGVEMRGAQILVSTDKESHTFDHVLVAGGYATDHILDRPKTLDIYARTVALFELSDTEVVRLRDMPTLVYDTPEDPYLLPPIRYPDGKNYLKLGGDPHDVPLNDMAAVSAWFRAGGSADVRDQLEVMIRRLMPDLQIASVKMDACVTSWTHDRRPEIGHVSDRIAVCTGGNGAGAKCSDELGRLGAALIAKHAGATI
ncbi:NAD(P)/FAD-dependent oxidoreductase [Litoreibacter roseus]|uniref:Sarcosine oxidase n=1 Tax=Litoreibacter roseus TaxID=2601869 RepID=A0A6N6JHR3_9RHOB|nr:FAD-dependent oxidoreductase [Litoreibacter roseus]GFE65477.1 sarcosine oxidase [Litoreibacter roseus]